MGLRWLRPPLDLALLCAALAGVASCGGAGVPTLDPDAADAHPALPDLVYGVTPTGDLVSFSASNPGVVFFSTPVSGLQAEETIVGIDFLPGTPALYGVSDRSRVYLVDRFTGEATPVGAQAFFPGLSGSTFAVEIDPVTREISVQSDQGQNLRLEPTTGAVLAVDSPPFYEPGDPGSGTVPAIATGGYTNSTLFASSTTLFAIDTAADTLVRMPDPSSGRVETVGSLGLDTSEMAGFDVAGSGNRAYAALNPYSTAFPVLFQVNLSTGALSLIGQIALAEPLRDIAVLPVVP